MWHALDRDEAARRLAVDSRRGLSEAEAARRLVEHGPNQLVERKPRPAWRLFVDQFADFMILVLMAAGVVAGALGEPRDAAAIAVIVLLNGGIGFAQSYRAQRAIAALKRLAAAQAQVLREGQRRTLPAHELVAGDLVLLEAGNVVPADLRLIETARLEIDESSLTGESLPVAKAAEPALAEKLAVADRRNLAYKGSVVTAGRARGLVVATGMATELGRIAALLAEESAPSTPLQRRLARFGSRLAWVVLAVCAMLFTAGLLRGEPPLLMLLTAVSLAVAAIPEALPAVVTVLLALGARTLVRQQALVRRLPAVETLGSVTFICSDKTGTLTQNRMQVARLVAGGLELDVATALPLAAARAAPWHGLLEAMALVNDAAAGEGDPTETALIDAAAAAGLAKPVLDAACPRRAEWPFDAERKRMSTLHQDAQGRWFSLTKGAPEVVLPRCTVADAAERASADRLAAEGLRVLAVARRDWPGAPPDDHADAVERELTLLGLVGMADPPRPEAQAAVAECQRAGIVPVMITGDHPATARAVAMQLNLLHAHERVLTGAELEAMDDDELADTVRRVRVYARVAPRQKVRIVQALQARGEYVAMTGDGVNDAPSLQRADIGVAMGRSGTDVAREAASLVLLDDNFATIVAAVREGRRIYDNIRKFVRFALAGNAAEIWTIAAAPMLGLPIPLLPIHILWVNLVTDGLPGLALAAEPAEPRVMQRPPRAPGESVFAQGTWQHVLWVGLLIGGLCLGLQAYTLERGNAHWQTMVFTVLTLAQMGHVLAVRSERESLAALGLASNRPLLGAVLLTIALQMAVIYLPPLQSVFATQALAFDELALCLALAALPFMAVEIEKWLVRHRGLYAPPIEDAASGARLAHRAPPP